MDGESIAAHVKSEDDYADTVEVVKARSDTSSHKIRRPCSVGKNKKVIALLEDKLGGRIIK